MKIKVDVLGSPSLIVRRVSVGVKQHLKKAVLGSPSLIVRTVFMDVKQYLKQKKKTLQSPGTV